jgi:hypothetical protein
MTQITDSDREERNSLLKLIDCMGDDNDCWRIDQAFARHRIQALSTQAAELDALREDVERSEKHRNDLADRNTSLSIENGALKATIAQLRDRVAKFAEILETVLPYTEAERLREEADVRCGRTYRNPIQKAVNKARALLTQNEVG